MLFWLIYLCNKLINNKYVNEYTYLLCAIAMIVNYFDVIVRHCHYVFCIDVYDRNIENINLRNFFFIHVLLIFCINV